MATEMERVEGATTLINVWSTPFPVQTDCHQRQIPLRMIVDSLDSNVAGRGRREHGSVLLNSGHGRMA